MGRAVIHTRAPEHLCHRGMEGEGWRKPELRLRDRLVEAAKTSDRVFIVRNMPQEPPKDGFLVISMLSYVAGRGDIRLTAFLASHAGTEAIDSVLTVMATVGLPSSGPCLECFDMLACFASSEGLRAGAEIAVEHDRLDVLHHLASHLDAAARSHVAKMPVPKDAAVRIKAIFAGIEAPF